MLVLAAKFTLSADRAFTKRSLGIRKAFRIWCHVEELALPTRGIQLSGEVLSTDEAASAELREAEAVHWARNSHRLFKAAPTTPCVC